MFTVQEMKAAHAKVKSGADFPAYVKAIKQLGLIHYDFMVKDGTTIYYGNDSQLAGDPVYPEKIIAGLPNAEKVREIIGRAPAG
jgi:uncharacterized protein YbcV (DUF1398 family)